MIALALAACLITASPDLPGIVWENDSGPYAVSFRVGHRYIKQNPIEIRWGNRTGLPPTILRNGMRVIVRDVDTFGAAVEIQSDPLGDFEAALAVEEWVRDVTPEHKRLEAIPTAAKGLLMRLASERYPAREKATAEILGLGYEAGPVLAWGIHAKDPEVRDRCLNILEGIRLGDGCPADYVPEPDNGYCPEGLGVILFEN